MDTSKIGVRYARALFGVAIEQKLTERIRKDFDLIALSFREHPELPAALNNPVVQPSKKAELMKAVFGELVHELSMRFITMVVQKRREDYLPDISRHYLKLHREMLGLKPARLVTATGISDKTRDEMVALIRKNFHSEVELNQEVNAAILGGFILQVDDQQLDASVTSGLRQIKRELSKRIR